MFWIGWHKNERKYLIANEKGKILGRKKRLKTLTISL
jgi:hypothetical protein